MARANIGKYASGTKVRFFGARALLCLTKPSIAVIEDLFVFMHKALIYCFSWNE